MCFGFGFLVVLVFLSLMAQTSSAMVDGKRERAIEMREK